MKRTDAPEEFRLIPVVRKRKLSKTDEAVDDVQYWLSRPARERIAAVTFLVFQSLVEGERMDKSVLVKKKLKLK